MKENKDFAEKILSACLGDLSYHRQSSSFSKVIRENKISWDLNTPLVARPFIPHWFETNVGECIKESKNCLSDLGVVL